mmetsp:Transcript_15255/g.22344  ORF Transcript_15255/g.22344 Transcript_15255/m.22344 type:complete len:242 (+) Transcript_15255:108-833(+)
MANNRSDFVGPILLAIFAYLASMLTRAFQRSIMESSTIVRTSMLNVNLNHTIQDQFITDQQMINTLQDQDVWKECDRSGARWWDGKTEPSNVWEQLSQKIWKDRWEYTQAAGFEYWCNIVKDKKNVPWHIDKDEAALRDHKRLITPLMGAVYYGFNHDGHFSGGLLQLIDADVGDNPLNYDLKHGGRRSNEVLEVTPNFNRLVLFNASKWHRVTGVYHGTRYTFAVNANRHKPKRLTKTGN